MNNPFAGTIVPKSVTKYNGHRGITDWGNVAQFNYYKKGYAFLILLRMPIFINKLCEKNNDIANLVTNYKHIIEHEFLGLEGLDNITSETLEISDGIGSINLHNKTVEQSAATITLTGYREHSGAVISKVHELILKGIYDGRSQVKHYHGLIQDGTLEKDPANEVMSMMYIVTDDTTLKIERAFALLAAQPTSSELSMYNVTRGDVTYQELGVEFNCFVTSGRDITERAQALLDDLKIVRNEDDFIYTGPHSTYAPTGKTTINYNSAPRKAQQPSI